MAEGVDSAADVVERLPGEAARVRRAGIVRLLRDRAPANVALLASDCQMSAAQVEAALAILAGFGAVTRDVDGAVVAVGGLSVVPTHHRLLLGDREFFTWCAFDAVGIPAALGVDAVAHTACGLCGAALQVRILGGDPWGDTGDLVGWLPGGPCTDVQADFCPSANLFCNRAQLNAWRAGAGTPSGRSASLAELAAEGRRVWADMRPTEPVANGLPTA